MHQNLSDTNRNKSRNDLLLFFICIVILSSISIFVFYHLYQISRKNLINMWNNNAIEMSKNVEFYLNTPKDAVTFTARKVDEMINDGLPLSRIQEYLIDETSVYATLIESNATGIYGYCCGEYLDGSGWTPPTDYEPKERPWYKAALDADGEVAFVKPYLNLQTDTMMMSVSILLSDKESAISMDIYLDSIQAIEEQMVRGRNNDAAMVIDKSGVIVTHSDADEIGKNYIINGNDTQKKLAESILDVETGIFPLHSEYGNDLVFSHQINNEWYSVLILNEQEIFKSIKNIYIISAIFLISIFSSFFIIISVYYRKNREVSELHDAINSIADIYKVMDLIDLKNQTIKPLRDSMLAVHFDGKDRHMLDLDTISLAIAANSSRNLLKQFMDTDTLEQRLNNVNSISHEYLSIENKWERMQIIVNERAGDGSLWKVLLTIQSIDEDRRQRESLKKQADTDALTGILNRSGGESRIYECMDSGQKGMFILLDADNFKHVNDTYGHDKGDEVIKAIAAALTVTFRDSDVVYRLGGDEFAAFAVNVDNHEIATLIINRLFENIDSISIDGITDWNVHVSVGSIIYDAKSGLSFSDLYKKADTAMYKSKQTKGNTCTFS